MEGKRGWQPLIIVCIVDLPSSSYIFSQSIEKVSKFVHFSLPNRDINPSRVWNSWYFKKSTIGIRIAYQIWGFLDIRQKRMRWCSFYALHREVRFQSPKVTSESRQKVGREAEEYNIALLDLLPLQTVQGEACRPGTPAT